MKAQSVGRWIAVLAEGHPKNDQGALLQSAFLRLDTATGEVNAAKLGDPRSTVKSAPIAPGATIAGRFMLIDNWRTVAEYNRQLEIYFIDSQTSAIHRCGVYRLKEFKLESVICTKQLE